MKLCYAGPFSATSVLGSRYRQYSKSGWRRSASTTRHVGRRGDRRYSSARWMLDGSPAGRSPPGRRVRPPSTGNCCRSSCLDSISTRTPAQGSIAAGARRQATRIACDDGVGMVLNHLSDVSPSSISTPCSPIWTRLGAPMSSTRMVRTYGSTTAFEFVRGGTQSRIGGGGCYDGLMLHQQRAGLVTGIRLSSERGQLCWRCRPRAGTGEGTAPGATCSACRLARTAGWRAGRLRAAGVQVDLAR